MINIFRGRSYIARTTRRWHGHIGFGPQFEGWQEVIDEVPQLRFNALQWRHCVTAILAAKPGIPPQNYLEIRYEDLVQHSDDVLHQVFAFLGKKMPDDFQARMPAVKSANFNKWERGFSSAEKALIGPIINPLLVQLGYAEDDQCYP